MRRPVQGDQLLTQHTGRAASRRVPCLLLDMISRPRQGNQLLTQHLGRAASRRALCLLLDMIFRPVYKNQRSIPLRAAIPWSNGCFTLRISDT